MESKKEVPVPVMEVESGESSTEETEAESPRSVVAEMKKKVERVVHSQVLRIREEDLHLGEEYLIGSRDKGNENDVTVGGCFVEKRRHPRVNVVFVTKSILPCSPLSDKNNVKTAPCS